jgi:hypothetical protein
MVEKREREKEKRKYVREIAPGNIYLSRSDDQRCQPFGSACMIYPQQPAISLSVASISIPVRVSQAKAGQDSCASVLTVLLKSMSMLGRWQKAPEKSWWWCAVEPLKSTSLPEHETGA